jgi:probable HAF family extracellular repeat protein
MKIIIGAVFLAATCLFYTNADGQVKNKQVKSTEIDFTIEIIGNSFNVVDRNRHGEMTGNPASYQQFHMPAVFADRKGVLTEFSCLQFDRPDHRSTLPVAINNDGTILANCDSGPFGLIRRKGGSLQHFSVPGADGTAGFAINDREDVVGEYYTPFPAPGVSGWHRFHSFLCKACGSPEQKITNVEAPPHADDLGAPHSLTRTLAYGINNRGQIIGKSETIFTPSNEVGMSSAFLYSNGQFEKLPADLDPQTINNDGTILAIKTSTGQFVLYDDGKVYTIALPEPYKWQWIKGLTDKGELFGTARIGQFPTAQMFQVIATPK